ncbi:MAG: hypothetical protein WD022_06105 [Balneolaceae bacterium]
MSEFGLLKISSKEDPLTGRVTFTETIQFKITMSIAMSVVITIFILDILNYDLPNWTEFLFGAGMVIAYSIAFITLFFSRNAGKVKFSENEISVHPKKNPDLFPDSPIDIDSNTKISINTLQSFRFLFTRTLLYIVVSKGDSEYRFGMIIKNREKEQQYLEVLESWYRTGYKVKEYDQLGNRVFKINQGKNYAEVQHIKQKYGIEW